MEIEVEVEVEEEDRWKELGVSEVLEEEAEAELEVQQEIALGDINRRAEVLQVCKCVTVTKLKTICI